MMSDEDLAKLEAMRDATESEITRILLTALIDLHTGVGPGEVMDSLKANASRAHAALLKECLEVVGDIDAKFGTTKFLYEPARQRETLDRLAPLTDTVLRTRALAAKIREAIGG